MSKKRTKSKTKSNTMKPKSANTKREKEQLALDIDLNNLDKEWCNQPRLYHKYASELAEARKELEESESNFKAIKATLDGLIRSDPESYDLPEKVTETAVASTIILQDQYSEAQKSVQDAQYKVNLLFAMVGSLDHKKAALENLVRLHGQDYFSTPRSDSEGRQRLERERGEKVAKKCRKAKAK